MKVRAPSADSRYFDVKKLIHGAEPAHDLRGGALPEHRRVLGPRHRDVPDPRRHVHPRLPLLLRPLRPARAPARPARAAAARAGGRADGAQARRRHLGRPRRPARPRRRPLRGDDPGAQGASCPSATVEVLTPDFLGVEEEALRTVLAAAARRLQPQHRDRAPAAPAHARREGVVRRRRSGCSRARRSSPTIPVLTKSRDHRRARRDERRGRRDDARPARARRRRRHDRPVPAA